MKILQILILVLCVSIVGNAQNTEPTTELRGTVTDQAGAVIPSTRVLLSNAKGDKFEALSDEDGTYLIRLPAGTYTLEAEYTKHQAWEKFKIEKYEIAATNQMTLDICLRVDKKGIEQYSFPIPAEPIKIQEKSKSP